MNTIYDFITKKINEYPKPITLEDGWDWSMKEHLRRSFLYLNSQFTDHNEDRTLRPNKNIVLAVMNVQYRTEGFDVKDIEIYVDDPDEYYKSDLSRKYHDDWALENSIDTFIDDLIYSFSSYGGVLVRNAGNSRPEVVNLRTIAFCDQRNLLAHPFGIKHSLSAVELREMKGWGLAENGATIDIEQLLVLGKKEGKDEVDVFEVHGAMPKEWLQHEFNEVDIEAADVPQIQVVAFYTDENKNQVGVTLFRTREPKLPFKMLKRDTVEDRALGRGGVEELFESQVWTNWNEIKVTEMLAAASKTVLLTDDPSIAAKHPSGLKNLDNLELVETKMGGKGVWQMDTYPRNSDLFEKSLQAWQEHVQQLGVASEGLLGEEPKSGVPFKLFEAQNIEAKGMHKFRQGRVAVFMDEIYRDWILPHIGKEIVNDKTFLADFSADEILSLAKQVSKNLASRKLVERILNGGTIKQGEREAMTQKINDDFIENGTKRFIDLLKEDFQNKKLAVKTNIAGKQKNLALLTDKIVNVLRQYIATPELRQDPEMAKLLNTILESSGLSPIMFGSLPPRQMQPAQNPGNMDSLKMLAQTNAGNSQGQA